MLKFEEIFFPEHFISLFFFFPFSPVKPEQYCLLRYFDVFL